MGANGVVLAYHAVGTVSRTAPLYNTFVARDAFESQMAFLARRRSVVALADLLNAGPAGPGRVAITFDDAYRSVLTDAAPVLRRFGFPATLFVPTRWIGDRNRWDPPNDLPLEILTRAELAELAQMGFEIGSHGHAHIDLSHGDPETVRADVDASVRIVEELVGTPPRYLAYPYGRSSPTARETVSAAGFEAAFALEEGGGRFAHDRVPIFPGDRGPLFAFKTSGHYIVFRRSRPVSATYRRLRPLLRRGRFWP